MSKKAFLKKVEGRARALQEENARRALDAITAAQRLAGDNTELVARLDEASAHLRMMVDWTATSYRPGDIRREQESKGSAKGAKGRSRNAQFISSDMMDELRAIYDPNLSAERHRTKLANAKPPINLSLRQVQRYLQKIRSGEN